MCARASQYGDLVQLREVFGPFAGDLPNAPPRYNAAPTDRLLVVRRHPRSGERHLDLLRWGLVPAWAKNLSLGASAINARSETVEGKPMFRAAWHGAKRCLIPLDSFFEWRKEGKARLPHAVAARDGAPLGLAGLWEGWRSPTGEIVRSFTILTIAANDLLAPLHERMPVIVPPEQYEAWLAGSAGTARALLRPYPSDALRLWPVSPAVNKVGVEGPGCVAPLAAA